MNIFVIELLVVLLLPMALGSILVLSTELGGHIGKIVQPPAEAIADYLQTAFGASQAYEVDWDKELELLVDQPASKKE